MIGRLLFWRSASGAAVPVDASHPLPVSMSAGVTLVPGDIELGAVELKDGSSDNRAAIDAAGALLARIKAGEVIGLDAATLAALETINAVVSGTVALDGATLAALESITVQNSAVEVTNDAGNPLPVSGTVEVVNDVGNALPTRETPAAVAATHTGDNAVTTAETILASNANRKGFLIQNLAASGGKSVRITIDNTTPTATLGIQLIAQATLLLTNPECGTNNVKCISEDGTSVNLGVTEFA